MDPALLVWPLALMAGMIAPGPINLTVGSVGLTRGLFAASAVAAGALIGDVIVATAVLGGAIWLADFQLTRQALMLGGGVFLAAMGVRMILSAPGTMKPAASFRPSAAVASGLLLALSNPKSLLLHLSAASLLLISATPLSPGRMAAAGAVVAVLNLLALSIYVGLAELARSSPRAIRSGPLLGRTSGAGLGLSGAVLLLHAAGSTSPATVVG